MTALLQSLDSLGANEQMIKPFGKVMKNATLSYLILIVMTYVISLFFWPTPAVPEVVGGTFEASLYEKQQINADAKLGAG